MRGGGYRWAARAGVERRSARVEIVERCIFALLVGEDESYVGCTYRSEEQEDGIEEQEDGMEEQEEGMEKKEEEDSRLYQPSRSLTHSGSHGINWLAGLRHCLFTGRML